MSDLSLANSVYEKIASEMQRMAELTQDAASAASKRSIDASMQRLHEAIAKAGDSAPRWPAASPDVSNDDQAVARYISELNQAVQYAHSQLFGQIELCSEAVGSIGRSRSTIQLPLAGGFGPMIATLLIYLICDVWRRKAELRRRERMRAAADKAGAVASGAFQQECSLVSDVITTSCAYLAVLPITTILLMIMEINGAAGWLISSSYICLLCATLIAAQPSFLASIWSRQDLVDVGQRLAVGIMTIASFCCAIHALKADASTSAMA
ncbi:hypothetical protein GGI12_006219 [Dipsacomyces acuminosporus]|nr:hypothetical protein GGI12_006219 [Dipsacomyces acuminosporus]